MKKYFLLILVVIIVGVLFIFEKGNLIKKDNYSNGVLTLNEKTIKVNIPQDLIFSLNSDSGTYAGVFKDGSGDLELIISNNRRQVDLINFKKIVQRGADLVRNDAKNDIIIQESKDVNGLTYYYKVIDKVEYEDSDKDNFKNMIQGSRLINNSVVDFTLLYEDYTEEKAKKILVEILESVF